MNKTKIEWCKYTWNPVVGCKNGCFYCYARKIRQRFNPDIPFETIVNYDERLNQPLKEKKPSRIFVGSMTDLFADWAHEYNVKNILEITQQCPQHTFLFLTKNPEGYGKYVFPHRPNNCWAGVTITNSCDTKKIGELIDNSHGLNTFVSIEPLMERIEPERLVNLRMIDWIIIGGLSPNPVHNRSWVDDIIKVCRQLNKPIFLKNNLHYNEIIKEIPLKQQ